MQMHINVLYINFTCDQEIFTTKKKIRPFPLSHIEIQ